MSLRLAGRVPFPIILLAAGASSRMKGEDKLMQMVDGQPLLQRQVDMALSVAGDAVYVALPPAPHPRHDMLQDCDAITVAVPDAAEGMNASLRQAFSALPTTAPAAMLLLADLPDLTGDDLLKIAGAVAPQDGTRIWQGATADGAPGHPIVFDAALFSEIRHLKGDTGAKSVVQDNQDKRMLVPLPGNRARLDLDTPEAWAAWRAANPDR